MNTPMTPPPTPPRPAGIPPKPPLPPPRPALSGPRAARAEATFNSALECPAEERAAYVHEACGDDAELQARVRELLAAHDAADDFLNSEPSMTPEIEEQLARLKPEEAGEMIGPYKLREQIGEGGFGTVWVADQEKPVRRRVALKIIKLGMDTKEVIARFEQERQALAMMDHPNIAKVLDAGATQYGRPFFVMELVRGVKITDYSDEQKLSTPERIELFITVCQAVQHAHQKGIIHRDLKPSNILVTINDGEAVPKVIDFGVAKATQGRLTDATIYTQFQQMIGTPLCMSPEQAELTSLDIDTRSDIYALGVLLYELLTGHTPIDQETMGRIGMDEMRRMIREVDPPRPSMRVKTLDGAELTTAAKRRHTDPARLPGTLRGDIDWIVMKCLEKDRKRRYETANGLALDLQRHLKNEVITARPPTAGYLLSKLIRRNKLAFAAGAAVAAALVLGVVVSSWQAVRATRATEKAEDNEKKAVEAQANETTQRQLADAARANEANLRQRAEGEELAARQRAYASDMNVAKQALDGNNLGRALNLLNRQRPKPGQRDLRGWEWRYLWEQTRSDALFTLDQKSTEIVSLSASPDGNWLAAGMHQQEGLSVWDLRTRQELVQLAKNENRVIAAFSSTESVLAFSSVTVLASGQSRNTLRLWNIATRQITAQIPLDGECHGLAFAQDGKTLVTATSEGVAGILTLWRMPDGNKLASYPTQQNTTGPGTCFAANSDLSLAAYGLLGGRIAVMDLRNGKELWTAVASKQLITGLAFSPDGKTLASAAGFSESDIRLWDVASGKPSGHLEGHSSWVSSLVFWPDGKKLASSSADQTIRIWDLASQKCLQVLIGHRQEVWRLAFLPDHKTLVSGAKDGTVCLWDTSVRRSRQPHLNISITRNLVNWSFTPDSRSVLTIDESGRVSRWSGPGFQQQEPLPEIGEVIKNNYRYSLYQFSRDGHFLAAGSTNGVLQVRDLVGRVPGRQWSNTTGVVWPAIFLANGTKLITVSQNDNMLHEWDLQTGLEIQSWQAPAQLYTAALSPDERACIAVGYGGDVVLRNLADQSQSKVALEIREANAAGYSPDGKLFAVSSDLGYARVWDTATWKLVATPGGFLNAAGSVGFSADGKRLAIASDNKEAVKLWDTESWQEVFTLEGQGFGFQGAYFSPDGNTLGWGNQTGLYLWRAPSWEEINAADANEKAASKQP